MFPFIPFLDHVWQGLTCVFTEPSLLTCREIFVGWVMCLGRRTEFRVFEAILGQRVSRLKRHPFDRFYNFFSRAAWSVRDLAQQVALKLVLAWQPAGELHVVIDGTLLYKSGKSVWGLGWFHDPVRSTKKRAATALGNKWVVLGLVVPIPGRQSYFCLPLHAALQRPGKDSEPALAEAMLQDVLAWFPQRQVLLVADGGFSSKYLLADLDPRVRYVGLMRGDAALHETRIPPRRQGKRGPTRKTGRRLPSPRDIARQADAAQKRRAGRWRWQTVRVFAYGQERRFGVCSFQATWPKVFGARVIQVVVCRALDTGYDEVYLYTTDLAASAAWVVEMYARRTTIEATFKSSKQVLEIQTPQHFCRASIEKLAPWVWLMQSVIALWYLTEGRHTPEARAARRELGAWETEWSFRHMLRLFRRITLRATIQSMSQSKHELQQLAARLENYLYSAA